MATTFDARQHWNWQLCHSGAHCTSASAVFIHVFFSASLPVFASTCQPHSTSSTWWDVIAGPLKWTQSFIATALIKNTCFIEHLYWTAPFFCHHQKKSSKNKQSYSKLFIFLFSLSYVLPHFFLTSYIYFVFHAAVKFGLRGIGVKGQLKHHTSLHFH